MRIEVKYSPVSGKTACLVIILKPHKVVSCYPLTWMEAL